MAFISPTGQCLPFTIASFGGERVSISSTSCGSGQAFPIDGTPSSAPISTPESSSLANAPNTIGSEILPNSSLIPNYQGEFDKSKFQKEGDKQQPDSGEKVTDPPAGRPYIWKYGNS
jgi:hypothetical protein